MPQTKAISSVRVAWRLACLVIAATIQMSAAYAEDPLLNLQAAESAKRDGAVGSTPFYESRRLKTCTNTNFCLLSFAAIPAGKRLEATNLNCLSTIQTTEGFVRLVVVQGPTTSPVTKADFVLNAINPGVTTPLFQMNESLRTFIESGTHPLVLISPGSTVPQMSIQCSLAGNLRTS